ncbi:thermonuclease family protein [Sphingosinicella terrae]|uniref:thermonuclease family protein n=1 Tax=Sphingosinicella terrae TaxID=2172047 RepID=UPI0013B474BE|nr:hypothetical protein [Sphingosinicella terrae]
MSKRRRSPVRRRRRTRLRRPLAALLVLALGAAGLGWSRAGNDAPAADAATFACTVASVTDGDTFRCAETNAQGRQIRLRLSGIAARERNGRCTDGHPCPSASAEAAAAELRRLAQGEPLTCCRVGTSFDRIAAFCRRRDGVDLSCAMVESGTAARWDRYWGSHRCP